MTPPQSLSLAAVLLLPRHHHNMPTPESESFLAKKPKVEPTFQGVDFADNEAVVNARDAIIREQWVKSMMTRLVGQEMGMFDFL